MKIIAFKTMLLTLLLLSNDVARAGPGHDHGESAATVTGAAAVPRFSAHSDLFEAVGSIENGHLTVYIDRYNNNAPVTDAVVEIESGATKLVGTLLKDSGSYEFEAAPFKAAGSYPITITIRAGKDSDILASDLVITPQAHNHSETGMLSSFVAKVRALRSNTMLLGIIAFFVGLFSWFAVRRRKLSLWSQK